MEPLHLALRAAAAAIGLAAGIYDLGFRRIPNWLVAAGLVAGFGLQASTGGYRGAADAALGFLLAAAVYLPLYLLRAVGGGDLKLMAAVGALVGPKNWLVVFALASVLGGAAALAIVVTQGRAARTFANIGAILRDLLRLAPPYRDRPDLDVNNPASARLPHGVMIALGIGLYLIAAAAA